MQLGDTFIRNPDDGRKEHLWIAVTDPQKNNGKFAAFNLTRSTGGAFALTFQIGDHPFIKRYPSDVNFGDALIFDIKKIENEIACNKSIPHQPMHHKMVEQIARKAIGHPAVPEEVEELVKGEWGF